MTAAPLLLSMVGVEWYWMGVVGVSVLVLVVLLLCVFNATTRPAHISLGQHSLLLYNT